MRSYLLDQLSNETLIAELGALVATDRKTVALLLAHLAEVDARMLYRPLAYSTMHEYCVAALHMSEDVAYKRCRAARAARRFPQLFDAIADGRLHVSGVAVLAPHVTAENVDALIAEATHRRKLEIEMIAARLAPRPDAPDALLPLSSATETSNEPAPSPVGASPSSPPPSRVKPLAPERFGLQTTISGATRDKLEHAKALMRHRNPSGDLEIILDAALEALITKLEKEKFAVTDRPRAGKPRPEGADASYVSAAVRREVYERDDDQCTYCGPDGRRCTEKGFLELDHATMACRKGPPTAENLRLRCRAHNQMAAEEALGADFMRARREAAERDRDVARALRDMGWKADEARLAMSNTAHVAANSLEERLRTALAELTRMRGNRCGEEGIDAPVASWTTAFAIPHYTRAAAPALQLA